jgi:hypothetical protein
MAGSNKQTLKFVIDMKKALADADYFEKRMSQLNARISAARKPSIKEALPGTGFATAGGSMQEQWEKSFSGMPRMGSYGAVQKYHPMAKIPIPEQPQKMSRYSQLLGGINEKLMRFGSSMGLIPPELSKLAGGLAKFGLMIGVVTAALKVFKWAMEKTFEMGNLVEGALIQMKVITNSSIKAHELLKASMKESLVTQFSPSQMLAATQMAIQYGLKPYQAGAHGLGKDQTLMKIISSMGSFRDSQGKALGPEKAIYAIARGDRRLLRPYGRDVGMAYEEAKKAGVTGSAAFVDKFIEKLGKIPYLMEMGKEQSDSMAGAWSTIAGFAEEFWFAFSGAGEQKGVITFWSQVRDILIDIRDGGIKFMQYISPYVTEFGAYVGSIFKFLWDVLKECWNIIGPFLIPAFKVIVQLIRIVWSISRFILTMFIDWMKIMVMFIKLPFQLVDAIFGISKGIGSLIDELTEFVTGFQITLMFIEIFVTGLIAEIERSFSAMIQGVEDMMDSLGEMLDEFADKHPTLFKILETTGDIAHYTGKMLFNPGGVVSDIYGATTEDNTGAGTVLAPGNEGEGNFFTRFEDKILGEDSQYKRSSEHRKRETEKWLKEHPESIMKQGRAKEGDKIIHNHYYNWHEKGGITNWTK